MSSSRQSDDKQLPATYFAPPERAAPEEVIEAVRKIGNSPMLNAALHGLGGEVSFTSTHEAGTTFSIRLPREYRRVAQRSS